LILERTINSTIIISEVQSGVQHLLGLISGLRRGGRGIPISSLVVECASESLIMIFAPSLAAPSRDRNT